MISVIIATIILFSFVSFATGLWIGQNLIGCLCSCL